MDNTKAVNYSTPPNFGAIPAPKKKELSNILSWIIDLILNLFCGFKEDDIEFLHGRVVVQVQPLGKEVVEEPNTGDKKISQISERNLGSATPAAAAEKPVFPKLNRNEIQRVTGKLERYIRDLPEVKSEEITLSLIKDHEEYIEEIKRSIQGNTKYELKELNRQLSIYKKIISNWNKNFDEKKKALKNKASLFLKQIQEKHLPDLRDKCLNNVEIQVKESKAQAARIFVRELRQYDEEPADLLAAIQQMDELIGKQQKLNQSLDTMIANGKSLNNLNT